MSTFSMWTRISSESQNETNSWGTSLTLPGLGFQSPRPTGWSLSLQSLFCSRTWRILKALSDHLSPLMGHFCLPHAASFPVSPSSTAYKKHRRHRPHPTSNLQGSWGGCKPRQQTIRAHRKAGVSISVFHVGAVRCQSPTYELTKKQGRTSSSYL